MSNDNAVDVGTEVAEVAEFKKSVTVDVKQSTVERVSTVRAQKGAAEQQVAWVYDFSDVSEEQLLELASRTVHILRQGQFRNAELADQRKMVDEREVDVAVMLAAERAAFKPTAKSVAKAIDKLSAAERATLLKQLMESE